MRITHSYCFAVEISTMKYYNLMEMASAYSILPLYQNLKYQCQNSLGLEVSMLGNVVRGFGLVQGWHDPEGSHYRKEAAYKMPPLYFVIARLALSAEAISWRGRRLTRTFQVLAMAKEAEA